MDLFSPCKYITNVEKAVYTWLRGRECLQDNRNSQYVLITESQSCWGWKGPQEIMESNPLQSRLSTAGVGLDGLQV